MKGQQISGQPLRHKRHRTSSRSCSLTSSLLGELLPHQAVQQIDSLQRTHHHLEVRDLTVIAEGDDVDAVDLDALDLVFEFEDGAISAAPFADIFEAGAAEDLLGARQIFEGDVAPA